jgi:hypothetical protein
MENRLYVADRTGVITALDVTNGDQAWTHTVGEPIVADPAVTGSTIYIGTRKGTVLGIDRNTGEKRWRMSLASAIVSPLTIVDGTLYAGTVDGNIVAITQDGSLFATAMHYIDIGVETVSANPLVTGGAVGGSALTIGGYAALRRRRSRDAEPTTEPQSTDIEEGHQPTANERLFPSPSPSSSSTEPIGSLPDTTARQPDLSEVTYADFEVGDLIGSGGNADVNKAVVEHDGREWTVALKTPRMADYETVDTSFFEEFVEEAKVWSRLDDHAGIVSVLG